MENYLLGMARRYLTKMEITSIYISIYALFYVILSFYVIKGRRKLKIGIGQSEQADLLKRIRAQGNFIEYTIIFILLLASAENLDFSNSSLHFMGILFFIGRLSHAYGLLFAEIYEGNQPKKNFKFRVGGMVITFTSIIHLAVSILTKHITG